MGVAKAHPDPWVFEEETREQDSNKNEDGVVVATRRAEPVEV